MSNVRILSIAILTAVSVHGMTQTKPDSSKSNTPLPSVLGGVGVLYFNGNIGSGSGVTAYSTVRTGYTLGIEERPVSFLGIELSGIIGKLAASERSENPSDNLNFQSNIVAGELDLNLHLDGLILKKDATIAPWIYVGFNYMSYSSYADTRDAKGEPYYYWTDGSIRNEPQEAQWIGGSNPAQVIQRSYKYDSLLNSGSYTCIPVGLGAKFHITENLCMNIQAAYYFTFSSNMEALSSEVTNKKNDKYLFSLCTLEYHFHKKNEGPEVDERPYVNVDFTTITVKDTLKKDEISKTQEEELLAKEKARDTSAVDRATAFFNNPNAGAGIVKSIDEQKHNVDPNKLPARFRPADKNHDGYISSQEITQAIDEFFDGTSTMTIADINALIDYFFDQ